MSNIVVLNQSGQTYRLAPIVTKDKEGKEIVTQRILRPGTSIETLDAAEAKHLLGYRGVVDASKVIPIQGNQLEALRKENAELKAQIEDLKKQNSSDEGGEGGKSKGKGKS